MGLEVNLDACCDECSCGLDSGDNVVCQECFDSEKDEKEKLEERIEELEELEEALKMCKANCETCKNRYDCIVNKKEEVGNKEIKE